jgi:hypothetical protein
MFLDGINGTWTGPFVKILKQYIPWAFLKTVPFQIFRPMYYKESVN